MEVLALEPSYASFVETEKGFVYKNLRYCTPIPLTQEILAKAGFKYEQDGGYFNDQYWISKNADGSFSFWLNYEENYIADVSYLHQLQNLYYTLTGKELTIEDLQTPEPPFNLVKSLQP